MSNYQKEQNKIQCKIVHNHYPMDATRVRRQSEALISHGYEVDIICLQNENEPKVENVGGVTVYRLPVSRNNKRGAFSQLFEYLTFLVLAFFKVTALHLRKKYPVVEVHNLPDFLVFSALVPWLTGSRVILELRDLMPEFYCSRFNVSMDSWMVRLIRWQEWVSCRFAHHVITVTEVWKQTLIERGVAPEKCTVVMNLADPRYFKRPAVVKPSPDDKRFRLIYHGTLAQRYGLDHLLYAIAQVREQIPEIYLIIHGQGDYRDTLLSMVGELQLSENVYIGPVLPLDELSKVILTAQVGVIPYRSDIFTDTLLPTKLMEYVLLDIPAIASRTPAIAAYFDDDMVRFFEPGDVDGLAKSIFYLYRHPERLKEQAVKSRKFNETYNWKSVSQQYINLVKSLSSVV